MSESVTDGKNPYLCLHAINVYVRDQDRSLQFYVDLLGFSLVCDAKLQSGGRWVAVAPPDGSAVLALIAPEAESREAKLIGRSTHATFVTEDVLGTFHEWRHRGVRFLNTPRLRRIHYAPVGRTRTAAADDGPPVWGGVFTRFKDPDGNTFALVGFDEVKRELEAQRRAAAERLEAERRAAQELEIATKVQARLFPQMRPAVETLEYAGICVQARQVGGDYYDFLDLGGGHFGLVVGDIAGKGMAAALLMANLQANLRSQCAIAWDQPHRFLEAVNRQFYENTVESAYATLFFAGYEGCSRNLRYVNCGHLPAIVLRYDGTLERLHSTSTVLGLFEEWDCSSAECRLSPGDTLALFTDGITEAADQAGEEFGEQRLIHALRERRELPPADLVASIVDEVRQFNVLEQHDDITLIAARCL